MGYTSSVTSLFFVVFALIIIVTRPVIGHLFDTKGPDYIVYPGFIVFLLGFILFASISSLTGLLLSGAVLGLGFGALSPAFQTLAVTMAPPSRASWQPDSVFKRLVSTVMTLRWIFRQSRLIQVAIL